MSDALRKAVDKAIVWHRQNEIRRIQEDGATAEHDEHSDNFDIYPDPYCRECRIDFPEQLSLADIEVPEIEFDDYGNECVKSADQLAKGVSYGTKNSRG